MPIGKSAFTSAKILNGANPAELPVQQSIKVELVINLRTARTLGLSIPLSAARHAPTR